MTMRAISGVLAASTITLLASTAFASHGFDGKALSGTSTTWDCSKILMPANATQTEVYLTGGTGDADLYVYNSTSTGAAPALAAAGYICRPYLGGNEENCDAAVPDPGTTAKYYWACIDGYTSFADAKLYGGYIAPAAAATANAADTTRTQYYVDYWKNNLFLGIAYHRIGCFSSYDPGTGTGIIVSEIDYDGFSDGDFCRKGTAWNSVPNYGAKDYMRSNQLSSDFNTARTTLDNCGLTANNAYGTANYARRSTTCSYNVLTNCNSDCWIQKFSNCVTPGSPLPIASPGCSL